MSEPQVTPHAGTPSRAQLRQRRRRTVRWLMVTSTVAVLTAPSGLVPLQAATGSSSTTQAPQGSPERAMAAAPAPVLNPANSSRAVLAVQTVRLAASEVEQTLQASGNIAAWQEASVSPRTGGLRVAKIHVQVGSRVKRGEPMLSFDDDTLRAELAQLKANLAEAEAAALEAQRNAARAQQVGESGAISAVQIEQHLTAEKTSQARVKALTESVKLQQIRLSQATLLAPDEGIVSYRAATLGSVVPAGMDLFRIIRGARLEWRAEVPAGAMSRLQPGMTARLNTEDGQPLEGTVRLVAPTVDPATRQGLVYVDLPKDSAFKPGMFARGEFAISQGQSWLLPQSAVVMRDGAQRVAVIQPDRRVNFVKVGVGRRQGPMLEITSGLDPQTRVVARGAALISDGDQVRVVDAAP